MPWLLYPWGKIPGTCSLGDWIGRTGDVNRRILWNIMEKRGFPRHLRGAIGSLYHNTSIILDLDGKLTKTITTNKGVWQGCCLSPTLFNIYVDDMLRTWKDQIISGIQLNKNTYISSILYADDMVIIQESEDELQRAIFKLNKITEDICL
jgi:hypothetical protein